MTVTIPRYSGCLRTVALLKMISPLASWKAMKQVPNILGMHDWMNKTEPMDQLMKVTTWAVTTDETFCLALE